MHVSRETLLLYGVTDRAWLGEQTLQEQVEEAILGGATLIQIREKHLGQEAFIAQAKLVKAVTDRYGVGLIVNDSLPVALAVEATGVHIGQEDGAVNKARQLLGDGKILGVSAQTVEQARLAQAQGADYLGVGTVFNTTTKDDASFVSFETLREICQAVKIPVVAIGGINLGNIHLLKGSGVDGVAVVSAIFSQKNIKEAAHHLRQAVLEII